MMITNNEIILFVGLVSSLGPTLAGLAAWNSSRKNATQESVDLVNSKVDELHGCVERHKHETATNFKKVNRALAALGVEVAAEGKSTRANTTDRAAEIRSGQNHGE